MPIVRSSHGTFVLRQRFRPSRFAVVAFIALFAFACGTASATQPGGVGGATLWFTASGYNGINWSDQSGSGSISATPSAPSGFTNPTAVSLDTNFNPGVSYDGNSQLLRGTLTSSAFSGANSYFFAVSNSALLNTSGNHWGDVLSGYNGPGQGLQYQGGQYQVDLNNTQLPGPFTQSAVGPILSDVSYKTAGNGINSAIAMNGLTNTYSNGNVVTAATQFEIGGRTSGGWSSRIFNGTIDEVIYFNSLASPLSATQISQVRSYLAIKYGITLGFNTATNAVTGTDYLSSAGTTVWAGASNATYAYDVTGIGKDATSGLDQRVSHSVNSSANGNALDVTIANGSALSTTSQTANTAFTSDQTFIVFGDNGGATTMSAQSGVYRMARVWRAQVTGSGSAHVTVQVPKAGLNGLATPVFWIASDANFQTGVTAVPLACGATYCTVSVPTSASGTTLFFSFGSLLLSGTVFEDVNYGGGAGRSLATSGGAGLSGATVELYTGGAFVSSTTTAANGTYSFAVNTSTTYIVRTVTPTTSSRPGGSTAGILPVQTYRTDAGSGTAGAVTDRVGGETPTLVDAAANGDSATLASLTTASATPQSITTATTTTANISGLDVGYNYDTIVNTNGAATQGTLGQFIVNVNALGNTSLAQTGQPAAQETSIFMISNGSAHPGLRSGLTNQLTNGIAVIALSASYALLTRANVAIDGTTQTADVGDTNAGSLGTGGTVGVDALTLAQVAAPEVELAGGGSYRALQVQAGATGFVLRGIALYYMASHLADIYSTGALIEKNIIGSHAAAFAPTAIANGGIYLRSGSAGTLQNNLIGFSLANNIRIYSNSTWTISNNEIRASSGSGSNVYACINILASGTPGTIAVSGNLITACANQAITSSNAGTLKSVTDNTLTSNQLGVAGASQPGLSGAVYLDGSGSGATVSKNVISGNFGAGIMVAGSGTNWTLSENSVFGNGTMTDNLGDAASGEIGIDLLTSAQSATPATPYITPNKNGGTAAGGNSLLDFPVFDGAAILGGNLVLTGYARPGATLEIFIADANPASGFGQGKTYVTTLTEGAGSAPVDADSTTGTYNNPGGNTNTGTDTTNRFRFSLPTPGGVTVGSVLTATALLSADGTSEFGSNIVVGNALGVPAIGTVLSVAPTGAQPPGATLTYTGIFTNSGAAQAYSFAIVDPVPANTDFQISSAATTLTNSNLTVSVNYSNDGGSTWTYTPVSGGGGAPSGYDRNVTSVQFVFSGSLSYNSPYNTGTFSLAVRIR